MGSSGGGVTLGDLFKLPKAHLHIHLECSVRSSLVKLWCEYAGIAEPDIQPWDSLSSFLTELDKVKAAIPSAEALQEAARLFVHDEASDGVVWTEPQIYPFVLGEGVRAEVLVDAVLNGLRMGQVETGIGAGLILAINRTKPAEEAVRIAEIAVERVDRGVVGLGLSNDEAAAPATAFKAAFDVAAGTPLLRVPHAGEALGPDSVRDALEVGPHRIMHGIRAVEDPGLFGVLAGAGIELDTAPSSNIELGVISSLEEFPVRQMLELGLRFSVGADCLLMMRTTATLELARVARTHGLDRCEMATIAESSLVASAAPRAVVDQNVAAVRQWAVA